MKIIISILVLFYSLNIMATGQAAEPDPLWLKVLEQRTAMKKWAAKNQELLVETKAKKITFKKQLTGWEQGAPVYTVVSTIPEDVVNKKPMNNMDFTKSFEKIFDDIYAPDANVIRKDRQTHHGKMLTLLSIKIGTLRKVALDMWVDADTAVIYDSEIEVYIPLTVQLKLNSTYQIDASGHNLPLKVETFFEILVPFKNDTVKMVETYSDWQESKAAKLPDTVETRKLSSL